MTDLQLFLSILKDGQEKYFDEYYTDGRGVVNFSLRKIQFLFNKEGKFDKIVNYK